MAISLGDAVLVFKGDQSDLDAAFASVPPKAEKSFGAASKVVQIFNDELDATGENVRFAGEKILSLTDAFRTLSIQGPERLKQKLDDAKNAFSTLEAAGVTAKGTLLQATIKVTEREIAYQQALGNSTVALNQQLATAQAQFASLGGPIKNTGTLMEQAAEKGTSAFHETRGSLSLISEMFGVHLPRELNGFLAKLGGMEEILGAAFSGIAIIALIEVIVKATEKLTEWVNETFIFTEAQKNLNAVLAESNKNIVDHIKAIEELNRQEELLGKTAAEAAAIKVQFAQEDFEKAAKSLRSVSDELYTVRNRFATLPESIALVNTQLRALHKDASAEDLKKLLLPESADREQVLGALSGLHDDLLANQKEFGKKLEIAQNEQGLALTKDQNTHDQATIAGSQQTSAALLDIHHDRARITLALTQASYSAQLAEQKNYEDARYRNQLSAEQRQLEILKRDPTTNADAIIAADAKILELQRQHEAASLASLATFLEKRRAILAAVRLPDADILKSLALPDTAKFAQAFIDPITHAYKSGMDQIETDTTIAVAHLLESYKELGIKGSLLIDQTGNLVSPLEKATNAYEQMRKTGIATYADLLKAQIAVAEAQIENDKETGESTKEHAKQLQRLLDLWDMLTGNVRRNQTVIDQWRKETQKNFNHVAAATKELKQMAADSLTELQHAMESAIASWILGQKSLGQAIREAVAQTLAAFAAKAAVQAIISTAEGFYLLAIHDYEGAASAFKAAAEFGIAAGAAGVAAHALAGTSSSNQGSPNAPGNLPPTPATTPAAPNPPPPIQVFRFAGGGLVSQPTLAIIGDSMRARAGGAREAVLPLDDSRSMDAIAGEISDRVRSDIALPNAPDFYAALRELFGGAPIQHVYNFKGDLVDHGQLMRVQSRMVKRGRARATASEALRVTRRA